MVAERDDVGAGIDQLAIDRLGDAETTGGILAIDGDEIELPLVDQSRQAIEHDLAPAAAHDVADEKNTHALSTSAKVDHLTLG